VPRGTEGFVGVTLIETNPAAVTDRFVLPDIAPDVAWIDVNPMPVEAARPAVLIVATAVDEEPHLTVDVKFCVLLLEYVPVAVNCCVLPS
jgi:hypothetical protein